MPEQEGSISRRDQLSQQIEAMRAELARTLQDNVDKEGNITYPNKQIVDDRIEHLEEGIKTAEEELAGLDQQ